MELVSSNASITELSPDRLYAIGGVVSASRPTTWIMPGLSGDLAVTCYLLLDQDEALLIDTGITIHSVAIANRIREVIGKARLSIIMTRREPDAIINLPFLVNAFDVQNVYCGGALSPLDFFERVDEKSLESHIVAISQFNVNWVRPGQSLRIGGLDLEMMRTRFMVLPKSHYYQPDTKTLFLSDTLGFLTQTGSCSSRILDQIDDRLSSKHIADYLRHKFDWMCGIDTTPLQEELTSILAKGIDRLCPTYGCIVQGEAVVAHTLTEMAEALLILSKEPISDRMKKFDREKYRRALARATSDETVVR